MSRTHRTTSTQPGMTRRSLLRAGVLAGVGMVVGRRRGGAAPLPDRFVVGQLSYQGGNWNPRPTAIRRLMWEVAKRTSIEVEMEPTVVRLGDPELFEYPFLYVAGDGEFDTWNEREVARLRRFLTYGGTLLADAADGPGGGFERSFRREMARVLPEAPLGKISAEHVLYKSFYLVDRQGGRVLERPYMEGCTVDGRLCVHYNANDLGGAWARDNFGAWRYPVTPGGESQREMAFRLGVNVVMYSLCLDYKEDQVHIPFILRRRR